MKLNHGNPFARTAGLLLVIAGIATGGVRAQEVAQATGKVEDRAGTPIADAVIVFRPESNPALEYKGTTSKKGRYVVPGLWSAKGDLWLMTIEAKGYVAVGVRVESRNVNRVLIGEIMDVTLKPGQKPPEIRIRPLGSAEVDWVMALEGEVPADTGTAEPTGSAETAGAAEESEDPWQQALTLARAGDLEASIEPFEKAIADRPDDAERREAFGKVLFQLGQLDRAEAEALKAAELAPSRVEAQILLFNVYERRGDLDKAKQALENGQRVAPKDRRLADRRIYLATKTGDRAGAISAYEELTVLDPSNAEAWLALGNLYHEAGRSGDSERAYGKVVEIDPKNAYQTYYNLGVLIMNRPERTEADTRRAIDAFQRSVEIKPDYGNAHQQLGFALLGVGDNAGALKELQTYLRVSPNAKDAEQIQALVQTLGAP